MNESEAHQTRIHDLFIHESKEFEVYIPPVYWLEEVSLSSSVFLEVITGDSLNAKGSNFRYLVKSLETSAIKMLLVLGIRNSGL